MIRKGTRYKGRKLRCMIGLPNKLTIGNEYEVIRYRRSTHMRHVTVLCDNGQYDEFSIGYFALPHAA